MGNDTTTISTRLQTILANLPAPSPSLPTADFTGTLADGTALARFDLASQPHSLRLAGRTWATLQNLSCLCTRQQDLLTGEVDATIQLGPTSLPVLLQLSGVLTDDAASSTWSVVLTAVSVDPLPLGALVAELFPIPEHLSRFALNNFRLELHWGPGETVLVGETPSTPVVFALLCSARLGGDTPWEVIPGLLSLSGPRLVAGYQGGRPYLDLYEKAVLFGLSWKIHLQLPIAAGSAELLSTGSVTMAGIVEHFGLHDPSKTLQSIGISHASCRFDVTNHLFGVTVELAPPEGGGWCLGPTWLQLTGVAFDLVHTPAGVAGRASASCKVGDATFRIQLEHPGPGLGWQIEASCDFPDQPGSLDHLLKKIAPGAPLLNNFQLTSVAFSYDTITGSLALQVVGKWESKSAELSFNRSGTPDGGSSWEVQGQLFLTNDDPDAILAFKVDSANTGTDLVAGYAAGGSGRLTLDRLIRALSGSKVDGLPDLQLQSALFVKTSSAKLIAADVTVEIPNSDLHKIPVLGERLSASASFGLNLHILYSTSPFESSEIAQLAPAGTPTLPGSVEKGFGSSGVDVQIGGKTIPLGGIHQQLPSVNDAPGTEAPDTNQPTQPPVPVHQNLGGVLDLRSVRPSLSGGALTLAVDGSVRFGPLTLDVIGFSIGYDLKKHQPTPPALRGLSLLLDKPPVRIEGGFLLVPATKDSPPDFVGKAEITTASFSLTALGGFTMIGGSPSLFVYGVLNLPLGGPPFFFVEGLAAGFGINRHLTPPGINDVETFPLVQAALPAPIDLTKLHQSLNPQLGSAFFAVGVKFNSFRLIHGFLLAIVAIDTASNEFEVALIGTGEWVSPPEATGVERMSYVRLDIVAAYSSRDGSLLVQAQLGPDCFVQNPLCHVSGGMALGSWLAGEHAGDFVFTVGGYHPAFAVPKHYPVPGRVTITYQISSEIHAGGSLYFALTPNNLMFGLAFNATWHTGPVRAWFDLGLDFLMKFKPLHYEATGHIDIGASVDLFLCTISVSAGADLHLWGPPLGGSAVVHLGPFHGQLSFGSPMAPPPPLTNSEFQTSFLPKDQNSVLSICPAGGLRTTTTASGLNTPYWSFNPKDLVLTVESLIPFDTPVSVPPMSTATQPATFTFTLKTVFYRQQEDSSWAVYDNATPSPTASKRFPPALWKAESGAAKLSAGQTYKGGALPLDGNLPPHQRGELSKGQTANQQTPAVRNAQPLPDQHHRDFKARGNDLSVYDQQPSAANAAFLDSLAIQLNDPALQASRHTDQRPAVSLLDPPRLITLP